MVHRFAAVPRRPVRLDADTAVVTSRSADRSQPPITLSPVADGIDLGGWAATHRHELLAHVREGGAVLLRGFNVETADAFERVAQELCAPLHAQYGDLPTATPGARVYGSTPYPEDRAILFHHESAHQSSWPKLMAFCCIEAAERGGETPIADARAVAAVLDPAVRDMFARRGLRYVRNFVPGFDVSWRTFFRTDDRAVVEEACRKAHTGFEWWADDCLQTTQIRPAVLTHPDTGEPVFFHQMLLHHLSCLEPAARDALLAECGPDHLPRQVYFADGSAIPDDAVAAVQRATNEAARTFPWQRGDVLMVDNMLVAHSRNPYRGSRRILVAMGDMQYEK